MIKLDILSDPICPWCLIGKTNLDRALQDNPNHPFAIEWHPFQLNPNMPSEGVDRRTYLEAKFGGQKGAIEVYSRIDVAAKDVGLDINWSGITRTPNTFNAHRLIHWAGIEGCQIAVVAALFQAYFFDGSDIGDTDTLVKIGETCGMDAGVTARLLSSESDRQPLRERESHSREMGVKSVPTFIVNNQAVVPGAQPASFWAEVIADYNTEEPAD
ncbi:MAG: DsbA family oxidoreductase [Paracoccaceae bacterium]